MRGESYEITVQFDIQARAEGEAREVLNAMMDDLPRRQAGEPGMNEYWMPLDRTCKECGAEEGEPCRTCCTVEGNARLGH